MAQKCRFSLAGCPSSLRTGDIYTHCLHGFKSTIIDGPSYVTSYDTQPNAVAPSVRADKNGTSSPLFVCFRCRFLMKKPDHDLICQARLGTRSQKETPATQHCFFSSLAGLAPWRCERVWDRPCCARREGEGSLLRRRARPRCGKQSDFPSCSVCGSAPAVGGLHNTPLHAALHVSFIHLHRRFVLLDGCRGRGA